MAASQPNQYLAKVRKDSANTYMETMKALQNGSSAFTMPYASMDSSGGAQAFKTGADAVGTGMSWMDSFRSARNSDLSNAAARTMQDFGRAASFKNEMEAREEIFDATQDAMQQQQAMGIAGSVIGAVVPFL